MKIVYVNIYVYVYMIDRYRFGYILGIFETDLV